MQTAVLFDFDGTLGDTETPAMEVAFWEVAPFLPTLPISDRAALEQVKSTFIQDNAGRAFELMVEDIDADLKKAGKPSVEEQWRAGVTNPDLLKVVNEARTKFGLVGLEQTHRAGTYTTIFHQQKEETNMALAVVTVANPGVKSVCQQLKASGIPFCIATTSGKPRVPISVEAAGMEDLFPLEKIHSGESDFNPPRFKPDPDVYLKAAEHENTQAKYCVAVEDSGSGVGSAANAGMGFIIGYVGGTHIPASKKESHARMLMSGSRSKDGRGAEIVVEDFTDVLRLVQAYITGLQGGTNGHRYEVPEDVRQSLAGRYWTSSRDGQ